METVRPNAGDPEPVVIRKLTVTSAILSYLDQGKSEGKTTNRRLNVHHPSQPKAIGTFQMILVVVS